MWNKQRLINSHQTCCGYIYFGRCRTPLFLESLFVTIVMCFFPNVGKKGTGKMGTEKRAQEKWAQEKRAQVKNRKKGHTSKKIDIT